MTNNTATPRPWAITERHATQNVRDPMFWEKDVIKGGIRVAKCAGFGKNEAEANAQLIVKAVNSHEKLVEALKIAEWMITTNQEYRPLQKNTEYMEEIREALKSAGEI